MSLIFGKALREAWDDLQIVDKTSISAQLGEIVPALRSIKPDISQSIGKLFIFNLLDAFVGLIKCSIALGSINGRTLQDRYFRYDYGWSVLFHQIVQ